MAVDLTAEAYQTLKQMFEQIFSSEENTEAFLNDTEGVFAAHGLDPSVLSGVDIDQFVESCAYPGSGGSGGAGGGGTGGGGGAGGGGGGGAGGGYSPPPQTVQQVSQVTQNYYQDQSTNIDNSVDLNVDGDLDGDIDITNVNATGDGAVAAGDDAEGVATGDGAVAAGDDINAPVNTGEFTGVQTDSGNVDDTIIGDHNQQVGDIDASGGDGSGQPGGDGGNVNLNFGDGDQTNVQDSTLTDAAVGGGDATNVSNNTVDDGSALAVNDSEATGEQDIDVELELGRGMREAEPLQLATADTGGPDEPGDEAGGA